MRKAIPFLATLIAMPFAAFAADAPQPAPAPPTAECPSDMVCLPRAFAQQAVLQLGLRDQIGQAIANALQQQAEAAQHRVAQPSHDAKQ